MTDEKQEPADTSITMEEPAEIDQQAEIIKRLDRIIELLELSAKVAEPPRRRYIGESVT